MRRHPTLKDMLSQTQMQIHVALESHLLYFSTQIELQRSIHMTKHYSPSMGCLLLLGRRHMIAQRLVGLIS